MAWGDANAGKLRAPIRHSVPILESSNEAVKIDGNRAVKNPACILKTHPRYLEPIFIAVSQDLCTVAGKHTLCAADRNRSPFSAIQMPNKEEWKPKGSRVLL